MAAVESTFPKGSRVNNDHLLPGREPCLSPLGGNTPSLATGCWQHQHSTLGSRSCALPFCALVMDRPHWVTRECPVPGLLDTRSVNRTAASGEAGSPHLWVSPLQSLHKVPSQSAVKPNRAGDRDSNKSKSKGLETKGYQ